MINFIWIVLQSHWHLLRDTVKAFDDFKNKQNSVWSNVCIFWKCIQYTIHSDKTKMLKEFSSDKTKGTKNALFFLSWPSTHHSYTFNLQFLYELKHKVLFLKLCAGFSIFDAVALLLKLIFFFNKIHGHFDFKTP